MFLKIITVALGLIRTSMLYQLQYMEVTKFRVEKAISDMEQKAGFVAIVLDLIGCK